MKNKTKVFVMLFLIISCFFININEVHAVECYYRLPFVGIDSSGNIYTPESLGCTKDSCTFVGKIESRDTVFRSEDVNYIKDEDISYLVLILTVVEKFYFSYHHPDVYKTWSDPGSDKNFSDYWYKEYSKDATRTSGFLIGTTSSNPSSCSDMDCVGNSQKILNTEECPRYIKVNTNPTSLPKEYSTSIFNTLDHYVRKVYDGHGGCDSEDTYNIDRLPGISDNYDSSIGEDSQTGFSHMYYELDDSSVDTIESNLGSYSTMYVPLIDFQDSDGKMTEEQNKANMDKAESNAQKVVNIATSRWYNKTVEYDNDLQKNCSSVSGKHWYDYINLKNYKEDVENRDGFMNYTLKDYNSAKSSLAKYDEGITEACWNSRKQIADAYYNSAVYFLLSIGLNRDGSTDTYIANKKTGNYYSTVFSTADFTPNYDETLASKWKLFEWHYKSFLYGVDSPYETFVSGNEDVEEVDSAYDELRKARKVYDIVLKDKCSYLCADPDTNELTSQRYEYCIAPGNNTNYTTCKNEIEMHYKTCNCESCEHIPVTDGREACFNTCYTCIDGKASLFDYEKYKQFLEKIEKNKTKEEDKVKKTIEKKKAKFKFIRIDPLGIEWHSYDYSGNCDDVWFLRGAWLIITIGAPFIVIILGSIDYFKNIVFSRSTNELVVDPHAYEREWTKNKRNFRRRIIALALLILLPVLIKIIIGNLTNDTSANNLKLMNCIVNGK